MVNEKLHIIPQEYRVNRRDREKLNGHKGLVIWFTGLSGSGKSTLANALEVALLDQNYHTYLLDGDNIRGGLNKDLDFTPASRQENIRRIAEVSALLADAGLITLAAFISPYQRERALVRETVGKENYLEVFVHCPVEECEKRDVKGLYQKARKGEISNFTGISAPFEEPVAPDITLHTHRNSIEDNLQELLPLVQKKLK